MTHLEPGETFREIVKSPETISDEGRTYQAARAAQALLDLPAADLVSYLESHEDDIANEINDFGRLRDVFSHIMGRNPEKCDTDHR